MPYKFAFRSLVAGIILCQLAACADNDNNGHTTGSLPDVGAEPSDDLGGKYLDEEARNSDGAQFVAEDRMVVRNGDISIAVEDTNR